MARPTKQGIDYYPKDIDADQDDKLAMIIAEYGVKGELFFDKLCGWIYKHEGYFVKWDESAQLRFLRRYDYCGFSVSFINEVVPKLIKWGLFDKTVFDSFQILTSQRIQSTWLEATRKRSGSKILPEYQIGGVSSGNLPEKTKLMPPEIPQSKVKKIKEKESKEETLAPVLEVNESGWHTKPGIESINLELPEDKAGAAIMLFKHAKRIDVSMDQLKDLWQVFKIQNFTGKKFYADITDTYSHFINWCKGIDVKDIPKEEAIVKSSNNWRQEKSDRILNAE